MPIRNLPLAALMWAAVVTAGVAEEKPPRVFDGDPYANETVEQRDARMAWWRDAKFGMFIHWGVYAVLAGEWNDVRDAEWIMRRGEIPVEEYRGYAKQFTAENYDPEAWADLAQKAGMRYMVITSKHHDGFALYPTKVSDWNAVDASPAKRDLLAPLAAAARERGIKFGLYYSHSQDWVHKGGAKWRYEEGGAWDDAHKGSYDDYLKAIAVPQVREILTRYQPDVLWWDTPHYMTPERSKPLAELLKLSPGIIHNDRLGGGYHGDTETPENFIPPAGYPGRDWETCMTMNDNWGYVRADNEWKTFEQVIGQLVDIVSKGGNYLLNVGPDASGRIPQPSIDLLTRVGAWMDVNGEAIYGTQASPFSCRLPWGRVTTKADGADTVLYLHVLDFPATGRLLLPGLKNEVLSAAALQGQGQLTVESSAHGPVVVLPELEPSDAGLTVKLKIKGDPEVGEVPVLVDPDGAYRLTPMDAEINGDMVLGQSWGLDRIGDWKDPKGTASWDVEASADGTYKVVIHTVAKEEGAVLGVHGIGDFNVKVPATKRWRRDYSAIELGAVTLKKGQKLEVTLKPVADGWVPINVHMLELVPAGN